MEIYKTNIICLFVGSCILLPYCFFDFIQTLDKNFLFSLMAAVVVMIALYYKAVLQSQVSTKWFWGWVGCLAIAISLQLFVIFNIVQESHSNK